MRKIFHIIVLLIYSIYLNTNKFFIKNSNANNFEQRVRRSFTKEEDEKLIGLVKCYGEKNCWREIADRMPNRNTKQCRERYFNYLSPNINNSPWTEKEDKLLEEKYEEYGSKWSFLKKFFKERSYINIRNRFIYLKRNGFIFNKKNKHNIEENENDFFQDFDNEVKDLMNSYGYYLNQ